MKSLISMRSQPPTLLAEGRAWLRQHFPTPAYLAGWAGACNFLLLHTPFLYSLIGIYTFGFAFAQILQVIPRKAKAIQTSALTLFASVSLLILAPLQPVFAQVTTASCTTTQGVFGALTDFFVQAFTAAGSTASSDDICFIFGIVAAILAVVFIITIAVSAYQVNQGAELRIAFIPVG